MAAYLVASLEINDNAGFEEYREQVPPVIAAYGGRYLVRGGATEVLEGTWPPRRSVILEFPNMDALKAFWESPEYRPLRAMRERCASSSIAAISGV